MFDFLEIFKPVTAYLIDTFGMFGTFLAMLVPIVALALALGVVYLAVILFGGLVLGKGKLGAKTMLKKANKLRAAGKYKEALDIYLRIRKKQKDAEVVTAYDIGMLCKEGEEDGWLLEHADASPTYWLRKSLNPLKPETHYQYGLCLVDRDVPLKAAEGAVHIRKAARLGCKEAKPLADKLEKEAAIAVAALDYCKAACCGHAEAQYIIATKAAGAEQIGWLELAADEKNLKACEELGKKYTRGEDVKENLSKAVAYLTPAAEAGSMNAQAYLGMIYGNKQYPCADEDQSIQWYTKAAEQGYAPAMYNLAVRYARKMEYYQKLYNLKTRLECFENRTYMQCYEKFAYWQKKAAEHGITPDSVK